MFALHFCRVNSYPMLELFFVVCLIAGLAFFFGPYELTMDEDDV